MIRAFRLAALLVVVTSAACSKPDEATKATSAGTAPGASAGAAPKGTAGTATPGGKTTTVVKGDNGEVKTGGGTTIVKGDNGDVKTGNGTTTVKGADGKTVEIKGGQVTVPGVGVVKTQ